MRKTWAALMAAALTVVPLAVVPLAATPVAALGNHLALTPPMGWNDWNAFGCDVSERLVEQTADKIVSSGLRTSGYQYVNIDDCWMGKSRDSGAISSPTRPSSHTASKALPTTYTPRASNSASTKAQAR